MGQRWRPSFPYSCWVRPILESNDELLNGNPVVVAPGAWVCQAARNVAPDTDSYPDDGWRDAAGQQRARVRLVPYRIVSKRLGLSMILRRIRPSLPKCCRTLASRSPRSKRGELSEAATSHWRAIARTAAAPLHCPSNLETGNYADQLAFYFRSRLPDKNGSRESQLHLMQHCCARKARWIMRRPARVGVTRRPPRPRLKGCIARIERGR
jgi:hypothetical protein